MSITVLLLFSVNKHVVYTRPEVANAYKLHEKFLPIYLHFQKDQEQISRYVDWSSSVRTSAESLFDCRRRQDIFISTEVSWQTMRLTQPVIQRVPGVAWATCEHEHPPSPKSEVNSKWRTIALPHMP